uniref:Chromosome 1 open reading frame 198 n=1 Tax=Bos indicus x Bos taurus TaxID=30522 RepID=A0A4W2GXS3_BOBOX
MPTARRGPGDVPVTSCAGQGEPRKVGAPREHTREPIWRTQRGIRGPMARKIMQDKEKIREKYGPEWARLPPAQQDEIIDRCLVGPSASAPGDPEELARFPGLRGPTGQKVVRFGDEDITWQDEHSAPFSWETRSQMEFSISSLSIQEPSCSTAGEPRPPSKAPQGSQALRAPQGGKSSSLDALGPAWKEEEASFWKINAERSRGEGPEAEFQSLTPSQIKSMEKGEKVLPGCYRQEPAPRAREAKAEKPSPLRQEQRAAPSVSTECERPQPAQACASPPSEAGPSGPMGKPVSPEVMEAVEDMEDALFLEPVPVQVSSSNVILKTGFDFLDNW